MVLGSIATSARPGDGRNHWHGSSARGGGERAGRGSNLQVFSGVSSIGRGNVFLRVRQLVQDSQKFMYHGKRHKLVAEDVDQALRVTGQEPLYGFRASEHIPFRCST